MSGQIVLYRIKFLLRANLINKPFLLITPIIHNDWRSDLSSFHVPSGTFIFVPLCSCMQSFNGIYCLVLSLSNDVQLRQPALELLNISLVFDINLDMRGISPDNEAYVNYHIRGDSI